MLSISDHLTRATAQAQGSPGSSAGARVYGALLGTQTGRDVEVQNSFEMRMHGDGSVVDAAWLVARLASCEWTASGLAAAKAARWRAAETDSTACAPTSACCLLA